MAANPWRVRGRKLLGLAADDEKVAAKMRESGGTGLNWQDDPGDPAEPGYAPKGFRETIAGGYDKGRFWDPKDWGGRMPTEGEKRANIRYGLGVGGWPASMEWWMDQHYQGMKEGRPAWMDYGGEATSQQDAMRGWQIGAMARPAEMRGKQLGALEMQRRRAEGKDLISEKMARQGAERIAAQAQSMAASAPGGYNPMAQRQAAMTGAGAQQQMAGQASIAGAQEMQAAQDAYLRGLGGVRAQDFQNVGMIGGIRGQDLMRRQQDIGRYGMDVNRFLKEQALKQGWVGQGMQDLRFNRSLAAQMAMQDPDWMRKLAAISPLIAGGVGLVSGSME